MGQGGLQVSRRTSRTFNSVIPGFLTRNLLRSSGTEARLGEPSKGLQTNRVLLNLPECPTAGDPMLRDGFPVADAVSCDSDIGVIRPCGTAECDE